MPSDTRREARAILDRNIAVALEAFVNLSIAEAEHPADAKLGEALDTLVVRMDHLVSLRAGLRQ